MKSNNTKQLCTNCKYFSRHYIIDNSGALIATYMGHCVHVEKPNRIAMKHTLNNEGCFLWQPHELHKLEVKYGIEQSLQKISDKVAEMLAVLRNIE